MDINKEITCKICNKIFENPVLLSCCEENVCKEHMDKLQSESSKISRCLLCTESMPKQKLPINKVLKNLIDDRKIQNFSIDSKYKDVLKNFKEKIKTIEDMHKDPDLIIHEKFQELRNEVDLDREKMKLEIDELADDLIKSLTSLETDLKKESKSFGNTIKCNDLIKIINEQLNDYQKSLMAFSESDRKKKIVDIKESISLLESVIKNYKRKLFKNQLINEPSMDNLIDINYGKLNISLMNGKLVKTLNGQYGAFSLALLDNQSLACGSADHRIRIWDVKDGNMIQTIGDQLGYSCVYNQSFPLIITERGYLASGSTVNYIINVWNVKNGKLIKSLTGHTNGVRSLAYNNGFLVSGSSDTTIKVWLMNEGRLLKTLEGMNKVMKTY